MEITSQRSSLQHIELGVKQRTYNEIVDYLDAHWAMAREKSLDRTKQLDTAVGSPSGAIPAIIVAGTNGKSLTIHFASKLLHAEGLTVGAYYSPHVLTYNERFVLNNTIISNKQFVDSANEVINAAERLQLSAHTSEILAVISFLFFKQSNVDVALLEADQGGLYNPVNICATQVATITRVTEPTPHTTAEELTALAQEALGVVKKGTYIVSGDQSKAILEVMQDTTEKLGGIWMMPIRKVVALVYPYEQLHGRCAALAERICQTFVEHFLKPSKVLSPDSLLKKQKIQRGRPTIQAKRHQELNPKKTLEQFWKETISELPGKFQLLDKEKPSILLDNAHNLDSFKNLLLGIRLLHYERALKGLTIIVGAAADTLFDDQQEFAKLLRYFFKKTSGQLLICPINEQVKGVNEDKGWNIEQVAHQIKSMKVKARTCKNFDEAYDIAKKSVDERHGLVVITGSYAIINQYWHHQGIKKF